MKGKNPALAVTPPTTPSSTPSTPGTDSNAISPFANPVHGVIRPVGNDFANSFVCTYIISFLSATNAELVTYPLDLIKTRLQIQGEAASKIKAKHRGMMATALGIVKEEGVLRLWGGMVSVLYRHAIYSGVRICFYDMLRQHFAEPLVDGKEQKLPVWKAALFGASAGAVGQFLASPADLVKVQLQMEGRRRLLGLPPRVHGATHAFKEVLKRGGIRGLWAGSIPNVQRAALINLGDLSAYDVSKHMIMDKFDMPDCRTVHILASICAGFVAAMLGTPADVIKTRVMNQPTDANGRGLLYRGSVDCLRQTVAKEGFPALYKGFLPCWIRLAPWALTFWVSFEQIRKMIGATGY